MLRLQRALAAPLTLCAAFALSSCLTGSLGRASVEETPDELGDAEIAGLVHAVNREVEQQALLGKQRAISNFTREYAVRMIARQAIAEHTLSAVVARSGISLAPSPLSDDVIGALAQTREFLTSIELAAFDAAFLQSQMQQSRRLIRLIDERLLPEAERGAMRSYLRDLRTSLKVQRRAARRTLLSSPLSLPN